MAKHEVWRGLSLPFKNGEPHTNGGDLMRCVYNDSTDTVTFEESAGEDAMGNPTWKVADIASQFVRNAASAMVNR